MEQITPNHWLILKAETRQELAKIFMLPKSGLVEVITNQYGQGEVKSDGHTYADLQAITVEKLVDYVGAAAINETIFDLFKRAIDKVETKDTPTIEKPVESPIIDAKVEEKPMLTVDNLLKCDKCEYETANKRALTMHKNIKHNVNAKAKKS